jgi:hypothetical protein
VRVKKKVKGRLAGSSTLQLLSLLYPTHEVVPSFISRGAIAPSGGEGPLLAKEGTLSVEGIWLTARNFPQLLGSFTCPQSWDMGHYLTSPPKEGMLRIFYTGKNPKASAGFEPANSGTRGQQAKPSEREG